MPTMHYAHRLASQVEAGTRTFADAASELRRYNNERTGNPNGLTPLDAEDWLFRTIQGEL